jgi:hypothetical protein
MLKSKLVHTIITKILVIDVCYERYLEINFPVNI